MSIRTITILSAVVLWTIPAQAQERGTVELGAFGSLGRFDQSLTLDHGYGGGGRAGIFLDPRVALEFEKGEMRATRTLGLTNVNVGILAGRLVVTPIQAGALSVLLGAGAGASTETNFLHSYGVTTLVGAKFALNNYVNFRVDGISDWLANNNWKSYQRMHIGLSFFRHPNVTHSVETVTTYVPGRDSVSWEEQARLRRADKAYRDLRDSLGHPRIVEMAPAATSASARETMEEKIHFATDKSDLSNDAKGILDAKIPIFRANPGMHIVIVGNTDERASDAYNMALGDRRSAAAKAYLVAQGIDGGRIQIKSLGERNPTAAGTSKTAQALNRRDEFRLLIASEYLVQPK